MSDVSDSDDEERSSLDLSLVSKQELRRKLLHLPNGKRRDLESTLKKFIPSGPLHVLPEEDEVVEDSDNEVEVPQVIQLVSVTPTNPTPVNLENEENASHLQAYMNSKYLTFVSERSLRKRNFASAHPYLSDQASYLGLADAGELNSVYEQNDQNLEAVVKLLNYNYLRLKTRYPKDEKFKQKSFYAIIGKQSKDAQNEEREKEKEDPSLDVNGDDEDEFRNVNSESLAVEQRFDSSQLLDHMAYDVSNHESETDTDSDSELDSSVEEEEKENLYVRVGGRYRKEKNALRGVLPESAKHLAIYKPKTAKKSKVLYPSREIKKGFAIKKMGSRSRHMHDDLEETFLNDDDTEDVSLDEYFTSDLHRPEANYDALQTIDYTEFSESEQSDTSLHTESDSDLDLFSFDNMRGVSSDLGEALENDAIDRMLTANSHTENDRRSKSSSKRKALKATNASRRGVNSFSRSVQGPSSSAIFPRKPGPKYNKNASTRGAPKITQRKHNSIKSFALDEIDTNTSTNSYDLGVGFGNGNATPKLPTSLTRSHLTSARKTIKKKKIKSVRNQALIENYFRPDKVGIHNHLARAPVLSSVDIEAESHEHRHQHLRKRPKHFNHLLNGQVQLSHEPLFAAGCLLNDIELTKLGNTGDGKSFHCFKDPVTVVFKEKHFSLSLIDIDGSRELAEKLCILLNSEFARGTIRKRDFYQCIRALIAWALILQRTPSESEWSWIESLLATLRDNAMMKMSDKFFCLPYLLLLQYITVIMNRINDGAGRRQNIGAYGSTYWSWFFVMIDEIQFDTLDLRGDAPTKQAESFYIMCRLLELQGAWWSSICLSIQSYERGNFHHLLEGVYYLCCITRKSPTWEPLQLVFQNFKDSTGSDVYYRFIEIIFGMNRLRNWQIDDKLILQMFGNITSRRFANLQDEEFTPSILSQVKSRFDIPGDSFFDRFMQLLFWHISSLTDVSQVKRLVTKLLSFNSTQHADTKEQRVMFINKFNLLILLSLISKTDLRTQVEILLSSITEVSELSFLKQVVQGIIAVIEIALSKGNKIPAQGVEVVTSKLALVAFSVHGATKLWKKFLRSLQSLLEGSSAEVSSIIQLLSLMKQMKAELPTSINKDIAGLCAFIVERLLAHKSEVKNASHMRTLTAARDKSLDVANSYMLKQTSDYGSSAIADKLIRCCLTIWVMVSELLNENWDKLILQTYPFIGDELSRDKYIFHFYMEVSRFYNLRNCKQSVAVNIVRGLSSCNTPPRLIEFINLLGDLGWALFSFHKLRSVPEVDLTNTKFGILTNMLHQSSVSRSSGELNMMVYEALKTMRRESTSFDEKYKSFCISLAKELKKYELDSRNRILLEEVNTLLGIEEELVANAHCVPEFEMDYEIEPFEHTRQESVHSLASLDDYYFTLQELLEDETRDSVSMWKAVLGTLENFNLDIFKHRFQFSNSHFLGIFKLFLKNLDACNADFEDEDLKLRVFTRICSTLREIHQILYEGYRVSTEFSTLFEEFESKLVEAFPFVQYYSDEADGLRRKFAVEFNQTFATNTATTDELYTDFNLQF